MGDVQRVVFRGEGGLTGWVNPGLPVIDGMSEPHTLVFLEDGQQVPVPVARLRQDADGGYSLLAIEEPAAVVSDAMVVEPAAGSTEVRNPLENVPEPIERVRITKQVEEQQHLVNEAVLRQDVVVERVAIGTMVDEVPPTREQNGTIIFPIVEEVLVVEKRYLLKEEVRVTRASATQPEERVFTTMTERAIVEPTTDAPTTGPLPSAFEPGSVVIGPDDPPTGRAQVL